MRIQHNIAALNSHRQLTGNNSAVAKNLEKLSSGYRINRAGDDAAGLAISEKMRAQITGLNTASKNAQDGISLVQTAEGALTEVHSMLNRMTELAGQAANGTYRNEVDRENVQEELNSLRSEIDRISKSTNFNGITLLDGKLSTKGAPSAPAEAVTISFTGPRGVDTDDVTAIAGKFEMNAVFKDYATMKNVGDKVSYTFEYTDKAGVKQSTTVDLTVAKKTGDDTKFVLKDVDGNETEFTTADGTAGVKIADIQAALKGALAADKNFSASFKTEDGTNTLAFTAMDKGTTGAVMTGIKGSTTIAGAVAGIDNSVKKVADSVDAYESVDLSSLTTFDGTNAKDAIFELNGKKFAFVDKDLTGDDLTKALDALKEAGVENYVQTAGHNAIAAVDITSMVSKINFATGLDVKQGTNDGAGKFTAGAAGVSISLTPRKTDGTEVEKPKVTGGLSLQIGESSDDFNQLTVSIDSMSTASLGIDKLSLATQDGAKSAVDLIKDAINTVSSTRGKLGAIQNRLEHTINNLGVTSENMTAAESRIRDVDMAQEMMNFTKNNILTQASQAMLAQANQLPQGVLQLLQ